MTLSIAASLIFAASLPAAPVGAQACRSLRVARPAGAPVSEEDVLPAACPDGAVPPGLRYDRRRGMAVARRDLEAGEPLGRVYLPPRPEVMPGDRLLVTARIGHVRIGREMTAVQPARLTQRLFVRDQAGRIHRAPPVGPAGAAEAGR